jgi:hypothetical protein
LIDHPFARRFFTHLSNAAVDAVNFLAVYNLVGTVGKNVSCSPEGAAVCSGTFPANRMHRRETANQFDRFVKLIER